MLHKSTKIVTGIAVILFVFSVAVGSVFFGMVTKQKNALAELTMTRAQAKAHQESLTALTRTLEETQEARDVLIAQILKEEDVIDLLALIESLGGEQGVTFTTNSLTVEPVSDSFEKLVVDMSVEGSYASVMHVLTLLENLPYQASVRRAHVSKSVDEDSVVWKGEFELSVTKFKKHEI